MFADFARMPKPFPPIIMPVVTGSNFGAEVVGVFYKNTVVGESSSSGS